VIGSERVLNWKEGLAEFNIQASWQANLPTDAEMQGMLRQWIGVTGTQGGIIELPGDIDAKWLIRGNGGSSRLQLDIVWACGSEAEGFNRYSLHANLPDPGRDTFAEVPESLLNRFHCYPADQ
jgi:hypothetical protein